MLQLVGRTEISPFLRSVITRGEIPALGRVLDAPTGYGRHSYCLALKGFSVVAADWDANRLDAARMANPAVAAEIEWRVADLRTHSETFDGSFDLMVCTHYFSPDIVDRAMEALKPNGFFLLESFGGQGENWRDLPLKGWARNRLETDFDIITLREGPVGPLKENVTLKILAKKNL